MLKVIDLPPFAAIPSRLYWHWNIPAFPPPSPPAGTVSANVNITLGRYDWRSGLRCVDLGNAGTLLVSYSNHRGVTIQRTYVVAPDLTVRR